jgi:phosphate transport system permease protein
MPAEGARSPGALVFRRLRRRRKKAVRFLGADLPISRPRRHNAGRLILMQSTMALASPAVPRRAAVGDAVFAILAYAAGILVLLLLGGIIISLFIGGLPAFRAFGPTFLINADWDPVQNVFGAAVPVYGTLVTAFLALLMAVPLAFGIAFWLTELAPVWLRRPVGVTIELLAAVPSIIYGMWGFFVIVPFMSTWFMPPLIDLLGDVPVIGALFQGPPFGTGLFTAALILAVMVIPFIAATMRDVFNTVPAVYKESAYGVGCTTWEVMRAIVIPYTRVSLVGGIMLGLGRALGETMAVTFVIGNTNNISTSLFGPGNTIASLVALEFPESPAGSLKLASLLALGFILFVISFIVLAISRLLLRPKAGT